MFRCQSGETHKNRLWRSPLLAQSWDEHNGNQSVIYFTIICPVNLVKLWLCSIFFFFVFLIEEFFAGRLMHAAETFSGVAPINYYPNHFRCIFFSFWFFFCVNKFCVLWRGGASIHLTSIVFFFLFASNYIFVRVLDSIVR